VDDLIAWDDLSKASLSREAFLLVVKEELKQYYPLNPAACLPSNTRTFIYE
jgi:hypothetical protein